MPMGLTVIVGRNDALVSPVTTFSDMAYAEIVLAPGARCLLRAEHVERAVYVVSGSVGAEGQSGALVAIELVVSKPGAEIILTSEQGARVMLFGGEP